MALAVPGAQFETTCRGCGTNIRLGPPNHTITMVRSGVNVDPGFVCPTCFNIGIVRRSEVSWTGKLKVRGSMVSALVSNPDYRPAVKIEAPTPSPSPVPEPQRTTSGASQPPTSVARDEEPEASPEDSALNVQPSGEDSGDTPRKEKRRGPKPDRR